MSDKEERSPALEALFAAIKRHPPLFHQRSSLFNPPDDQPSGAVYYCFDVALNEQDEAMVLHVVSLDSIPIYTNSPPAPPERPHAYTDLPVVPRSPNGWICNLLLRSIEDELRERGTPLSIMRGIC